MENLSDFVESNLDDILDRIFDVYEEESVERADKGSDTGFNGSDDSSSIDVDCDVTINGVTLYVTGTMNATWHFTRITSYDYYTPDTDEVEFVKGNLKNVVFTFFDEQDNEVTYEKEHIEL